MCELNILITCGVRVCWLTKLFHSASTATLVRLKYLATYNSPDNYLLNIANTAIWSIVESGLGLIAGSLATLRPLLKHIPFFRSESTAQANKRASNTNQFNMHSFATPKNLTNIKAGDIDSEWERLSDEESQQTMIFRTDVHPGPRDIKVTTELRQKSVDPLDDDLRTIDRFDED